MFMKFDRNVFYDPNHSGKYLFCYTVRKGLLTTTHPTTATINLEIEGIGNLTFLALSMSSGLLQREKKISFLELVIGSKFRPPGLLREIKSSKSLGRNVSQTISDCAAAWKARETADDLQTSKGVVSDKMLAITPSGREEKWVLPSLPSMLFFGVKG